MKGWALVLLLAAGFGVGAMLLFEQQFTTGEGYPEYSSLRSDPSGARILHDSLARLPAVSVSRAFGPLDQSKETAATILILAVSAQEVSRDAALYEELARRGNRIVVALEGVDNDVRRFTDALNRWKAPVPFVEDLVVRPFGKGTLVLAPDVREFSNHTLAGDWDAAYLAEILGPNRKIVFDESHLGLSESGSIVGLARHFRLQGAAFGMALCVGLFLWRSMSPFPPVPPAAPETDIAGRNSASGLVSLLRQNVPAPELAATAWRLWRRSNPTSVPESRIDAAEAALQAAPNPLAAMAAARKILERRRDT